MYESLLSEAYEEQVEVFDFPLRDRTKGLCHNNVIAINSNIPTTAEKTCILAEELGHYYTSVGNILDQAPLPHKKQEVLARRWAYRRLIPLGKLVDAYMSGFRTCHELAEYFNVTEPFLISVLQYYITRYGFYEGNCLTAIG